MKCNTCHRALEDARFVNCQACRDKGAAYQRAHVARRIEQGACTQCNLPSVTVWHCEHHAERANLHIMRLQNERKRRGECVECAAPVPTKHVRCEQCRERESGRRQARVESWLRAGLCANCGSRKGRRGKYCAACIGRLRDQRKRWSEGGLCTKCGSEREDKKYRHCLACRELAARNQRESRRRRGIAPGDRPLGARG